MFGERLKLARKRAGLSLRELANQLQHAVSAQAIGKYERGEMLPNSSIALALAKVLHVSMAYLFSPAEIKLEKVDFNKSPSIRASERSSIEAIVIDHIDRYLLIEELLNIKSNIWNKPEGFPFHIDALDQVEIAAEKIRKAWKLGFAPISNLIEMLEGHGIKIIQVNFPLSVDGLTCEAITSSNERVPIIVGSLNQSKEQQRFTLAHELGHRLLSINPKIDAETACDLFASAFLMPKAALLQEIGSHRKAFSYSELMDIKLLYGVGATSLVKRLHNIGIIADSTVQTIFRTIGKTWRKQEPVSCNQSESPKRFKRLVLRGLVEDIISLSKAAELLDMKTSDIEKILTGPRL
jgi:Zn-dependent peptidase ImmA (M78 family)/DNA-binding XRE family transcriptional regulator